MSELSEKLIGIKRLPIFPLPLVLLPDELLPLHIFEPRYRKMLKDVESADNVFGVSRFEPGDSFAEKPAVNSVGCAAEIRETNELPDGRSNILTIGAARYRLLEYLDEGEEYLVADVEFFVDEEEDAAELKVLADEVHGLFQRVAQAAHKLSGQRGEFPGIPQTSPEQLSFLVTAAFNLENELKYRLLETRSTLERLDSLREILNQAVGKLEENAEIQKVAHTNGHSKKKIEM